MSEHQRPALVAVERLSAKQRVEPCALGTHPREFDRVVRPRETPRGEVAA